MARQPDLPEQPRAIAAAHSPALQQIRLIRRQHTAPGAPGLLPFGRTAKGEIAVDRAPRCANDLGDIEDGGLFFNLADGVVARRERYVAGRPSITLLGAPVGIIAVKVK